MAANNYLAVFAAFLSIAAACPSSTTTTPCPTLASGTTTCASGSTCVTAAQACTDSTKSCQTTASYQLCVIATTQGGSGITQTGSAVKFCLASAATCTSALSSGAAQQTATPNSYTTFSDCCAATTTTAANIRYEYIPLTSPTNPTLACIAGPDATPYKVAATTTKAGYCTRFPYTATGTDALQTGTAMATAAPANTYIYSTFAACCTGIMGGASNVNSWGTVSAYGLTLEKCIAATP